MRLAELCLALLYAAGTGTGTEQPRAARERPLAPGRGEPGAARVDPRQAWMLLAGSPGRGSGDRGPGSPGKTTAGAAQAGGTGAGPAAPVVPEELLRELQLLLRGMAKMCRTAGEGCKEEESSKGSAQAGAQRRVEAAFHCQTRADIAVEQKTWQELGLFYIPEREGMFHRGPGLNLTSGQYTAPLAGYYTFSTTLHIGDAQGAAEKEAGMPREPPAGADLCAVLLPAQQPSGERIPAGEQWGPFHHLCHRHPLPAGWAVCLCFCGQHGRLSPHHSKRLRFQCCSAGSVKRLNLCQEHRPFPLPATIVSPLLSTKPKEDHLLMQGAAVWSDTARAEDGQKIMKKMMMMMIAIKQPEQDLNAFTFISGLGLEVYLGKRC